jgi:hypothetical protein
MEAVTPTAPPIDIGINASHFKTMIPVRNRISDTDINRDVKNAER